MDWPSLAQAYLAAPDVTLVSGEAIRAYVSHYLSLPLPCRVEPIDADPYTSRDMMRDQVISTGVLYVWTGASDGLAWPAWANWGLRAAHDLLTHLGPDGGCDFSPEGELEAWRRQSAALPSLAWLGWSEVVCQAAVAATLGSFPQQRIVRLRHPGA